MGLWALLKAVVRLVGESEDAWLPRTFASRQPPRQYPTGQEELALVRESVQYRLGDLLFVSWRQLPKDLRTDDALGQLKLGRYTRADALKVTHHGSSSGTARSLVEAVHPGIAIASTGDDSGHRLERDTLDRLGGHSGRPPTGARGVRPVFETLINGDIILLTDGRPYRGGILYQVEFEGPERFAKDLGAELMLLKDVDASRTTSSHPECE